MKRSLLNHFLKLVLLLFSFVSFSYEKPDWTIKIPSEDINYKYYVGRSMNLEDEAQAFNEATQDAYSQAIQENFGVITSIESAAYQAEKDFTVTKRIRDKSDEVNIEGFEKINSYIEKLNDNKIKVFLLFKYSKAAIKKEKLRLSKIGRKKTNVTFSEAGNKNSKNGILEVITNPPGANISIDDNPTSFLSTPLRLYGKISVGKHTITIDHPQYETIEEEFIMVPGSTIKIDKVLRPAYGELKISSKPTDAFIYINGVQKGKTPNTIRIRAFIPVKLELKHPECGNMAQMVQTLKGDVKEIHIELPLKPGTVFINSVPSKASVEIRRSSFNKCLTTPTGPVRLEAGSYDITIKKSGYVTIESRFKLKGNEKKTLPIFKLEKKGYLSITTTPSKANILITSTNGFFAETHVSPIKRVALPPDGYKIVVSKEGWQDYETNVEIESGVHRELSNIELDKIESTTFDSYNYYDYSTNFNYSTNAFSKLQEYISNIFTDFPGPRVILGANFSFRTATIAQSDLTGIVGVSVVIQLRICRYFGIEWEGSFHYLDNFDSFTEDASGQSKTSRIAFPIYLWPDTGFFVAPELFSISNNITYNTGWHGEYKYSQTVNQTGKGLSLGWLFWEEREKNSVPIGYLAQFGIKEPTTGITSIYFAFGIFSGWGQ